MSTAFAEDAVGATVFTPHMYYFGSRLSERISRTPEGYLVCRDVPIARTGWQEYTADEIGACNDRQTTVRVYRSPDEVFSPATIASFEGKSVTNQHPPEFLSSANFNAYHRGHAQNVRASHLIDSEGERLLLADLVIMDELLINEVVNGKREISCGYSCDYQRISSHASDYKQTLIRGNHIAVVSSARAGYDVRIYDAAKSKEDVMPETTNQQTDGGLGMLSGFVKLLRDLGWGPQHRNTADAESETVLAQEKVNAEAKKRFKRIAEGEPNTATGATDDVDWKHRITNAEDRLTKLEAAKRKSTNDDDDDTVDTDDANDAEKKETPEEEEPETKDADLIPVATLSSEEIPCNPIPGADSKTVDYLRKIKPLVAKHGTRDQRQAFNRAMRTVKGQKVGTAPYSAMLHTKKPQEVESVEMRANSMQIDATTKATDAAKQFVASAKRYHRKNIDSVQ